MHGANHAALLAPEDLLPLARARYDAAIKHQGVSALPIILDKTLSVDDQKVRRVEDNLALPEGKRGE